VFVTLKMFIYVVANASSIILTGNDQQRFVEFPSSSTFANLRKVFELDSFKFKVQSHGFEHIWHRPDHSTRNDTGPDC
jgi:hypothetical protein